MPSTRFNIVSVLPDGTRGGPLLGHWQTSEAAAQHWVGVYTKKYINQPYPNGLGYYPWTHFEVTTK